MAWQIARSKILLQSLSFLRSGSALVSRGFAARRSPLAARRSPLAARRTPLAARPSRLPSFLVLAFYRVSKEK